MEIQNINLDMYQSSQTGRSDLASRSREAGTLRTVSSPASDQRGDRVSVSREALLRTEAYRTASSSGDMRQDKVDVIKAEIAQGTYKIDSHHIAMKLIQSEVGLFRL